MYQFHFLHKLSRTRIQFITIEFSRKKSGNHPTSRTESGKQQATLADSAIAAKRKTAHSNERVEEIGMRLTLLLRKRSLKKPPANPIYQSQVRSRVTALFLKGVGDRKGIIRYYVNKTSNSDQLMKISQLFLQSYKILFKTVNLVQKRNFCTASRSPPSGIPQDVFQGVPRKASGRHRVGRAIFCKQQRVSACVLGFTIRGRHEHVYKYRPKYFPVYNYVVYIQYISIEMCLPDNLSF